jgi:hypothetical protein
MEQIEPEDEIPPIVKFEFIQKLLRGVNELRLPDTPLNELAFVYKEGHQQGIDDVMNLLRREL